MSDDSDHDAIGDLTKEGTNLSGSSVPLHTNVAGASSMVERVPPKFVPAPFPYHFQVTLKIDTLSDMGWGRGHLFTERYDTNDGSKGNTTTNDDITTGSDEKTVLDKVPENWEVRVPLVLPGEVVKARIFKNFDSHSEADLMEVIQPSEDRVDPQCPLAGTCGGCQFQHMKIDRQREWKTDFVRRGIVAQAIQGYTSLNSIDEKLFPTVGTDEIYHYRNKLTPHYQAPVKMGDDEYELEAIGFQQILSRKLVDVEDCPIATPAINIKFKETRRSLHEQAKNGLLNNKKRRRKNRRSRNVDVGATLLFRQADNDEDGNPVVVTDYNEYMTTTVKGIKFRYQAGNFFQNNDYVVPLMVDGVLEAALQPVSGSDSDKVPSYFIDCYCGSGLFALSASSKFKLCVGIEVNEKAAKEAGDNAKLNNISNCQFVAASAEALFTSSPALTIPGFEEQKIQDFPRDETVVVLDPPRKGCSGTFLEQLFAYSPQRIIYMSCGPSTQARDAKGIVEIGGYDIVSIQPYDLFPQTKHVECLMVFEKKAK
ncbi:TrmA family RNA methyltransferase [Nitzschia inconspicua]|uniref:TrmA family RNA methyltransferase n=1 Tax=Nitzschia inconspicua TaxID=303405 RepID=A0A9K3LSK0_9STRA|nr:TrmA family RNA methyltransferase [Nitzschia inconspicua]